MLSVVVVEDSGPVRLVWRDLVEQIDGMEIVGEFGNVAEAIAGIRSIEPDLVLLDIQLGDGSGLDVLAMIRSDYPQTRVLVVTNYVDDVYRTKCADAGAHGFFDKNRDLRRFRRHLEELAGAPG